MDSRTLKRLFPFIAGGACTKDQAAALALCATGDEGRVAGGMVVVEAEAASRMLTVIGLALQGRADVLEAKQRLAEVEEQVAWMDARLEELQKQARELEQRFDKELFALERDLALAGLVLVDAVTPDVLGLPGGAPVIHAFGRLLQVVSHGARFGGNGGPCP